MKPKSSPAVAPGRRTPRGTALDAAFRILGARPHAVRELRVKLLQRGYQREEVELAERRLMELGYLDDAAFALTLVASRSASRGQTAMAAELYAKGVPRDVAALALSEVGEEAEGQAAVRLARSALRLVAEPDHKDLARVAARLRRRGFSEAVTMRALREATS